ncbi:hypothetical protein BDBG_01646 [Blastomyces gilchristii SLH14081]|uniref:Uncharacterized protein n=1 Tax=Blastomyces gilchristii (strain SLH14081) TaxID=559298 RepID=A0A179UB84_BLAGS|nr:uncharacterized protein BDBG_01646 [Blastomyces gilchristii SLH14081]OAT05214.1 hypothetical protein BDBG_01646 [Blastomyces gilchristii SLH14081]
MQNLSENLLKAVRKAAETAELELKLYQVFTMKSFINTITIINKNRENQILSLQQKIEYLHRQMTTSNLEISSQLFTISSEVYTSLKTAVQNENLSMKYIKSEDLLKLSSFNSN